MTRTTTLASIALLVFLVILTLTACTVRLGLLSDHVMTLWANAITAGDGKMSGERILAAYPTVPFLATALVAAIAPTDTPAPALVAAAVAGCLAALWFQAFRKTGLSYLIAGAVTLLLIFHPILLRAAVAGPAEMFLALFLYLFGMALFDLRARSGVSEVMKTGLVLLGLAFSHPLGAAMAFSATPFVICAVQPALAAGSALCVELALIFPTAFAFAAFAYVRWIFPGSGWSFFALPAQSLAMWLAGMAGNLKAFPVLSPAVVMLIAFVMAAPLVPVAMAWVLRRPPLAAPLLVYSTAVIVAAIGAIVTGSFGDPVPLVAAAPVLGAIVVARIPAVPQRFTIVMPLLLIGWLGGAAAAALVDPRGVTQGLALLDARSDRATRDALALGGATIGRNGVLVDSIDAPAVVIGRGDARGLLSPLDATFALALMLSRIDTPFVAIPNPRTLTGTQDRLDQAFPQLFFKGLPGYRLAYQNAAWRLFARE